jgi:hypothetical protein
VTSPSHSPARALAALGCLGIGFVAGWMSRPAMPPSPAPAATTKEPDEAPAVQAFVERAQLSALLRSIVREELERGGGKCAPATASAPSAPAAAAATPSVPTAEQVEARDSGQSIIAAAHRAGRWTDDDRLRFRDVLRRVDSDGRAELMRTLVPAINRQEIKLDVHGPPL